MLKNKRLLLVIILGILSLGAFVLYNWYYQVIPQAGISLLTQIDQPKASDTIAVFSPHPDDETIAVGGYIKSATDKGANIWIVLVTNGNKYREEKLRYKEFASATSILGMPANHLIYLNYPDGKLARQDQNKVKADFKKAIDKIKPNIVIIPHPKDHHADHRTTGIDAEQVLAEMNLKPTVYYYLVHFPHYPLPSKLDQNLYLLPPLRLIEINRLWKSFPLTSSVEEAKLEATLQYKSQFIYPPLKDIIEGLVRKNELFSVNK